VCKELIGNEAIGFINRGIARIPETPFAEDNPVCLSCGACAYLCPTGKIELRDRETREIEAWHKRGELAVCPECGRKFAPLKQLEEAKKKIANKELAEIFDLCPECRKLRIARSGSWNPARGAVGEST
jgi:Fe-S-cluster-containing hydrogenase component 2